MDQVVIIGGVAGGMSAAAKLRRLDKKVKILVFEKDSYISYGACGLPYYIAGVTKSHQDLLARTKEDFEKSNIHVHIHHDVTRIDPNQKIIYVTDLQTGHQKTVKYDKLLIATGAKPIIPPFVPKEVKNVHTLKSMDDGINMREFFQDEEIKKVGIIGAGYIGMELVESMIALKKEVCVIELQDQILPNYDKDMVDVLADSLNDRVTISTGEKVKELRVQDKSVTHIITDRTSYDVDAVIVNIGNKPNTEFIKELGINMLDNGAIIVNSQQQTSIADIYAAGDCATSHHLILNKQVNIALGTTANKHGRIAASNMAGISTNFPGIVGTNVVKVLDWTVGMTGITEKQAKEENVEYDTVVVKTNNHAAHYPETEKIVIKLVYEKNSKILLGAQMLSKDDSIAKRLDVFVVAITNKMTTTQIGMLDLSYAPPYATVWDAVQIAANAAK
ncbi:CoA-disulfide reductase [Sutcliffiella rhizosphaerae]|uniref:NADH peroxidase n=1 Tax=Sutcliffiella rhizosphaerae TaxID=2880967 RepID=A0ABM8YKV1_9BACI|nr:CoA-disulfide reductase [Sutcliffiella rhizosphaerae]CAG9620554.1 NADH peroxidase [Sutcliffiella rhizosphaerae]